MPASPAARRGALQRAGADSVPLSFSSVSSSQPKSAGPPRLFEYFSSARFFRVSARGASRSKLLSPLLLLLILLAAPLLWTSLPAPQTRPPLFVFPGVSQASAAPRGQPELKIGPAQVLLPSPAPAPDPRVPSPALSVRTLLIVEQNGASLSSPPCFYWTAQHPDLIRLLHPDCSPSQPSSACFLPSASLSAAGDGAPACLPRVLVEASPHTHRRGRSWIFATPAAQPNAGRQVSPTSMRVQAVVAPITRLAFRTRDRRLAVGQLGDVGVLAFDEEGNIFTSLQGLVFLWRFEGERGILQAEDISSDAEAATPTRRWVERTSEKAAGGVHAPESAAARVGSTGSAGAFWRSDMLLVRGLKTGKATIIVRLAGEHYQHVGEARVSFVVHEPVMLLPSFQVLPPAAVYQYRLLRLRERTENASGSPEDSFALSPHSRGPSYVSLPSPHCKFSAVDLAVYDAQDRLPLARAADAASSSLVSIDPSGLLRVESPPEFPGEGVQATRFGLEGASLLRAVDTRTGEEQHAEVLVLVPSALRLFVDDVQALEPQAVWRQLLLAVRKQVRNLGGGQQGDEAQSRDLLLSKLVERAWGRGDLRFDKKLDEGDALGAPPAELVMSLVKTSSRRGSEDEEEEGEAVLYLVRGTEYLCKVEMLARRLPQGLGGRGEASGTAGEEELTEPQHAPPGADTSFENRSTQDQDDAQFLVVSTPKNAAFHWICESEEDEDSETGESERDRETAFERDNCGLQRKGSGQQFLAWFSATRRSQGRLTASLLHVGSRSGGAKAFWQPPVPLSLSLRFRVVDPVFLLFFPHPREETGDAVRLSTEQPLLLPPLHSFEVEPWGGSGSYTLTSDSPLISVQRLPPSPAAPPFSSSGLLGPLSWGDNPRAPRASSDSPRVRFRLENRARNSGDGKAAGKARGGAHATGAAVLRLQDARQPQNVFEFLVVVAEPERVEVSVDTFLIRQSGKATNEHGRDSRRGALREDRRNGDASGQIRDDVTHAIAVVTAYARIPPMLALPPKVAEWLSRSSLSSSRAPSLDSAAHAVRQAASDWSTELDRADERAWLSRHPFHLHPLQFANCTNLLPAAGEKREDRRFWTNSPEILMISELRPALPYTCGVFRLTGKAPGSARFFFSPSASLTAGVTVDVFPPLEAWVVLDRLFLPLPFSSRAPPHRALHASSSASAGVSSASEGDTAGPKGSRFEPQRLSPPSACQECASPLLYSAPVSSVASYHPAVAYSQENGETPREEILTLAVGSSLTFFTKGGPPARPALYTQHYTGELESDASPNASLLAIANENRDVLRVVCVHPGTVPARVIMEMTNRPREGVDVDAVSTSVRLAIVCSIPHRLEIFTLPSFSTPTAAVASPKPVTLASFPVSPSAAAAPQVSPVSPVSPLSAPTLFLRCGATHRFLAVAYDAHGQPVVNATSFSVSTDSWNLTRDGRFPPAETGEASGESGAGRVSLVSFFEDFEAIGSRGTARSEAVAVQVAPSSCCGVFALSAHLTWPTADSVVTEPALRGEDRAVLVKALREAREALRGEAQTAKASAWRADRLAASLSLVVLPPPRFLAPHASFLPGFFPPQRERTPAPIRLFYHPGLVYRVLLQFASPHSQLKVLPVGSELSPPFAVYTETPGSALLTEHTQAAFFSGLSPEATLRRFASLFHASTEPQGGPIAPSGKQRGSAHFLTPQDGLDVTTLVLAASRAQRDAAVSPLFRLPPPFAWPGNGRVCSPACPVTEQEVFIRPPSAAGGLTREADARDTRGPVVSGRLVVDDTGVLGDTQAQEEGTKGQAPPAVDLQFFSVARLTLAVLPPETLLTRSARGSPGREEQRKDWIQGDWGEIEKGKTYGVKVAAFAADGERLDPAFYRAMELALKISRKSKRDSGAEEAVPAASGRPEDDDASEGAAGRATGWLYVQRAEFDEQEEARPNFPPQSVSEAEISAVASFSPAAGGFGAFPALRGEAASELLWKTEVRRLFAESPCGGGDAAQPSRDDCPDFFFYVDGFEPDTELLLSVEAVNWAAPPASRSAASALAAQAGRLAVSAEMSLALYPPLRVFPASLVLLPGGHSLQLTVRGGPRRRRGDARKLDGVPQSSAVRRCESSDAAVVAARVGQRDSGPVAREEGDETASGDSWDAFPVVELLTGEEGQAVLTVHAGDQTADGSPPAASAPSQSRFLQLRRAAATVEVVVALPARVVIAQRSPVPGGNGFVSAHQERLVQNLQRLRFGAELATSSANANTHEEPFAHRADAPVQLGVDLTQKLHAFLYDAEGREFNFGHLAAPTGDVAGVGVDRETLEGRRRLEQFGPFAALPPAAASLCTYTWRVVDGETSAVGLLDPNAVELAATCEAKPLRPCAFSALPLPAAAAALRRSVSGGMPSITVVGLREGTARLRLGVECAPRRREPGRPVKKVVLETEVSIVVSAVPLFSTLATSSALLESPSLSSDVALGRAALSAFRAWKPAGPAWWYGLFASSSALPSTLLAAPASEYRMPCCRVRLLPDASSQEASCPCASEGVRREQKQTEANPSPATCACAASPNAKPLEVLPGEGGFLTSPAVASTRLQIEVRPSRGASFAASQSGSEASAGKEIDARRRDASWQVTRVDVVAVASVELRVPTRTMERAVRQRGEIVLKDAKGRVILPPTDLRIDVFSSHTSVVAAEVETRDARHPFGPPTVVLQASSAQSGCAAVTVFLLSPAFLSDTVRVCTDSRAFPSPVALALRPALSALPALHAASALPVLPGSVVHVLPDTKVSVHRVQPHVSFRLTFRLQPLLASLLALAVDGAGTAESPQAPLVHLFPAFVWRGAREVAASAPDCLSLHAVARIVDLFAPALAQSLHISLASLFAELRSQVASGPEAGSVFSPAFAIDEPLVHFAEEPVIPFQRFAFCGKRPASAARQSCAAGVGRCASDSPAPPFASTSAALLPSSLSLRVSLHDVPAVLASLVFNESEREGKDGGAVNDVLLRVDGVDAFFTLLRRQLASSWWREQKAYRQRKGATEERSCALPGRQTRDRTGRRSAFSSGGDARVGASVSRGRDGEETGKHASTLPTDECTDTPFGGSRDVPSSVSRFFSLLGFLDWSASFSPSSSCLSPLCASPFFAAPAAHALWSSSRPAVASVHTPRSFPPRGASPFAASETAGNDAYDVESPTAIALSPGLASVRTNKSAVLNLDVVPVRGSERETADEVPASAKRLRLVAAAGCAAQFAENAETQEAPLLSVASAAWGVLSEGEVLPVSRLERLGCARRRDGEGGGESLVSLSRRAPSREDSTRGGRTETRALPPEGEILFFRLQASLSPTAAAPQRGSGGERGERTEISSGAAWSDVASSVYVQSSGGVQCAVGDPRLAPLFVVETAQLPLLSLDGESETTGRPVRTQASEAGKGGLTHPWMSRGDGGDALQLAHACAFQERRLLSVKSDLPHLLRLAQADAASSSAPSRETAQAEETAASFPCGSASLSFASSARNAATSAASLHTFFLPISVSVRTTLASRLLAFPPGRLVALTTSDERGDAAQTSLRQRMRYLFEKSRQPFPDSRGEAVHSPFVPSACLALSFQPKMHVLFDARAMHVATPHVLYVKETQWRRGGDAEGRSEGPTSEDLFEAATAGGTGEARSLGETERPEEPERSRGSAALRVADAGAKLPLTVFVYPVPPLPSEEAASNRVSVDVSVSSEAYTVRAQQRGLLLAIRVDAAPAEAPSETSRGQKRVQKEAAPQWSVWTAPESAQLTIESREWKQIVTLSLERTTARLHTTEEEKGEETRLLFPSTFFSSSVSKRSVRSEGESLGETGSRQRNEQARTERKQKEDDGQDPTRSIGEWLIVLTLVGVGLLFLLHQFCDFFRRRPSPAGPLTPRKDATAAASLAFASTSFASSRFAPGKSAPSRTATEGPTLLREKAKLQAARQADAEALSSALAASRGGRDEGLGGSVRTPQQKLQMQPDGQWKWVGESGGEESVPESLWRNAGDFYGRMRKSCK
ncbi:hypothetical protein NCLIV_006640 [Neospora caninum Liverpool]|uniref:NUP210 Ig-like domain-containing protein n=1 Tax=Neospora caninum (strain Liverpool) TaxID=572307 RepID=F0V8Z8_NEOCL|nr:hypothetical protein NCLIV_006640 [Neospora caninum Liverpool]CBZ50189.1 hypothetical protein NCLIV_006640 [Neospora caninum Liverpool]CEL64791.1 TPA: hypothetical protein BN1204_006640 [Neospora caninum Liverpool]|eukprot:XP_003880224.1 hypothetical protein NCLIV_006640 [Neospora caninum Liverpool]